MLYSQLQLDLDKIEFIIQRIMEKGDDEDYRKTIDYLNTKANSFQNLIDRIPPVKCP